ERRALHIGLGVARPDQAQLAELPGEGLGSRRVVGEGVVVEEELFDLRKGGLGPTDLFEHMADAAGAIAMPAHGLRPEAECAARFAAPPRVERDVWVFQVAVE